MSAATSVEFVNTDDEPIADFDHYQRPLPRVDEMVALPDVTGRVEDVKHCPAEGFVTVTVQPVKIVETDGGQGLYQKYEVTRDGEPVDNCFVLEPESDAAAFEALRAYAGATDDPELAADLWDWISTLEDEIPGTLIKVTASFDEDAPEWHHSVEFDGYIHQFACGETTGSVHIDQVLMDIPTNLETGNTCSECKAATLGGDHDE